MKLTKEQLKKLIKEELENMGEADEYSGPERRAVPRGPAAAAPKTAEVPNPAPTPPMQKASGGGDQEKFLKGFEGSLKSLRDLNTRLTAELKNMYSYMQNLDRAWSLEEKKKAKPAPPMVKDEE